MSHIVPLPSFERSIRQITKGDRRKIVSALEKFNRFLETGDINPGLGLKKVNHDKYELRADIRLRIIMKKLNNDYYLVLVGNHDDVVRYLRAFRNK